MGKFRNNFSFCVKAICASLLSFLGFESSSEIHVMYGMPVGNFEIKGAVTDADTKEPVKNAQIKAKYDNEVNQTVISIARSDSAGNYTLSGQAVSNRLQIICTPVDTLLRPDTITVNLSYLRNDSLPTKSVNEYRKIKKKPLSPPAPKQFNRQRGSAKKTLNFTLNRKK